MHYPIPFLNFWFIASTSCRLIATSPLVQKHLLYVQVAELASLAQLQYFSLVRQPCVIRRRTLCAELLFPDCVRFSCCLPLAACVRFSCSRSLGCYSPNASASTAAPRLLNCCSPDCVRFNCCSPIASASTAARPISSASTAAPRLHTSACWIPAHAQAQCTRTFFAEFEVQ